MRHVYLSEYFQAGKNIDKWLYDLGGNRLMPVGLVDENVSASKHGGMFGWNLAVTPLSARRFSDTDYSIEN